MGGVTGEVSTGPWKKPPGEALLGEKVSPTAPALLPVYPHSQWAVPMRHIPLVWGDTCLPF